VRLQHRGSVLRVSSRKLRGAVRYVVIARLRSGRVRIVFVRPTSVRVNGIPRTEAGQITVRAIGTDGRPGPAVGIRFRATAKPQTILHPLPQARRR
jgi:hypothetical protein